MSRVTKIVFFLESFFTMYLNEGEKSKGEGGEGRRNERRKERSEKERKER